MSLLLLVGCNNDDDGGDEEPQISYDEQLEIDTGIIDDYLSDNNIQADIHESGLRYVINEQGEGDTPTGGSVVIAAYEGRFFDGSVFDRASTAEFRLTGVIPGWQIGLPLIQSGGSITLYIPSGLGYGTNGNPLGEIGPNTNLIFDVRILGVD